MKSIDLKTFRESNNLTQIEVGDYLGVRKAFISAVENGRSKLPKDKLTLLLQNPYGWDTSMLTHQSEVATVENPVPQGAHIGYLERKIDDQDLLIRELYQKIGALERELELARKGEIAGIAVISADANV